MEWGKFPIYLTLKRINIFFAITWFCHSDEYQWEMVSYVIQTTARSKNLLFCAHKRRAFISHCHQHLSFRCFPFKYPYGLWQANRTVVPPTETIVPNLWNGCAKRLAQLCHCDGTVVPKAWHKHAKGVAQAKHTFYSSSAILSLPSKHTYKGTLYQIVKPYYQGVLSGANYLIINSLPTKSWQMTIKHQF